MLSRAFQNTDRFKKARKALSETMKLTGESDDDFCWLLCNMGRIYEGSGYFHKALEWFKKAHEQNNSEATFLIYQGIIFLRTEKFYEAAEVFIKATNCKEGCIDEAFYNLGVVRIAQRKYQEAQKCFEKALKIEPKYQEAKQQFKDVKKVLQILEQK